MKRAIATVTRLPAAAPAALSEEQIWTNLRQYAADARGAFAANTERALKADLATFTTWCSHAGHQAMPASAETVAAFVAEMAECKAPATVRRYISSVSTYHRAGGVPNPCETQKVRLRLKAMHNAKGRAQRQADPVNETIVRDLLKPAERGLRDTRDRALLTLAYATLCRRAELVELRVEDVTAEPDGFGTVLIRRSKSDQEGVGAIVPIPSDVMRYLTQWIERAGIESGALFRPVRASGSVGAGALSPIDVNRILKGMARRARLPAEAVAGISGHSCRIGAAADMLRAREQMPAIMQAGRWKSPAMVAAYTRKVAARDSAAKRLADAREPF